MAYYLNNHLLFCSKLTKCPQGYLFQFGFHAINALAILAKMIIMASYKVANGYRRFGCAEI